MQKSEVWKTRAEGRPNGSPRVGGGDQHLCAARDLVQGTDARPRSRDRPECRLMSRAHVTSICKASFALPERGNCDHSGCNQTRTGGLTHPDESSNPSLWNLDLSQAPRYPGTTVVGETGVEPVTPGLSNRCSTIELFAVPGATPFPMLFAGRARPMRVQTESAASRSRPKFVKSPSKQKPRRVSDTRRGGGSLRLNRSASPAARVAARGIDISRCPRDGWRFART
jgi:hypothetical protein